MFIPLTTWVSTDWTFNSETARLTFEDNDFEANSISFLNDDKSVYAVHPPAKVVCWTAGVWSFTRSVTFMTVNHG